MAEENFVLRLNIVAEDKEAMVRTLQLAADHLMGKQTRGEEPANARRGGPYRGGVGGASIQYSVSRYEMNWYSLEGPKDVAYKIVLGEEGR